MRIYQKKSHISADALVFFVLSKKIALKCRKMLLKYNISTKILPEAYTWHFAGSWSHIPEVKNFKNIKNDLKTSEHLLSKSVSIPIFAKMKKKQFDNIFKAIKEATE